MPAALYNKVVGYIPYCQGAAAIARALKMLGKKTDALAASNKSIELAKKGKNDDYVALNEKLQKEMK